jgi:hypothetical protein
MSTFSWLVERFSRSLLNKRLLRDFLKEELDEQQTCVALAAPFCPPELSYPGSSTLLLLLR